MMQCVKGFNVSQVAVVSIQIQWLVYKYNLAMSGMIQICNEVKATLFHFTSQLAISCHICDVIKQNESELANIDF